jgi:photosynthetic reaction center H subunit
MQTGSLTQYVDVAQVALYVFWIFFAGLILYLRREDKREGYPLETELPDGIRVQGFPAMPEPKTFLLRDGTTVMAPSGKKVARAELKAAPNGPFPGAPLDPTGNPMLDGIGPGAYADRADVTDKTVDGTDKIVPLRIAADFELESRDPDPRGMDVYGADGVVGGVVRDVWVDRSECILRYLEVEVAGGRHVLLPMNFSRVSGSPRRVTVKSVMGRHFAEVPGTRSAESITLLEEEKIMAYYGGGTLYAEASRMGPLL